MTVSATVLLFACLPIASGAQAERAGPPSLPSEFNEPLTLPHAPADLTTDKPRRVFLELRLAELVPVRGLAFEAQVKNSGKKVYIHYNAVATHTDLLSARVVDATGRNEIALTLNPQAAASLTSATAKHTGRPLAVVLDGEVVSVLTIRGPLGAEVVFSGEFTREEAARIAAGLQRW